MTSDEDEEEVLPGGDSEAADGVLMIRGGMGPPNGRPERAPREPRFYLVVHAIKSADNLGSLLRTAGAFGCHEVLVVNAERTSKRLRKTTKTYGAHGADRRVPIRAFATWDLLVGFARRQGCDIVGIEIDDNAVACTAPGAFGQPTRPSCFVPGNEGIGLLDAQIRLCDRLVYVPHYGAATQSLNVNAATAIVLSHFAAAAGYSEASRSGAKYDVADPFHPIGLVPGCSDDQPHRTDATTDDTSS